MHFQQKFRCFVLILVSGTDGYTTSVKPDFSHSYAVFGSIAWVERKVKGECSFSPEALFQFTNRANFRSAKTHKVRDEGFLPNLFKRSFTALIPVYLFGLLVSEI